MKSILLVAAIFLLISRAFGAAPATLASNIYYEHYSLSGVGASGEATSSAIVLNSDGTFSGLFTMSRSSSGHSTSKQVDGTYSYRKIDAQTGELILNGIPFAGTYGGSTRTLQFGTDNTGTIATSYSIFPQYADFKTASLSTRAPLSNCSNRSFVNVGGAAFTGFVITSGSGFVLVRAIGPSLAAFGITNSLQTPRLSIINTATGVAIDSNSDWTSESAQAISRTGAIVGAFPLAQNSKDAALILSVGPGAYVAQVTSTNATDSGQALIEVYVLP